MKTVFISIPWFTPAFKAGGPVQSIANMVHEMDTGYQFFIFTSNTDLNSLPIAITTINEWVHFNSYTKVWYSGKDKRSNQLVKQVEKIKPDILYMVGMFSWHFTIVPLFFAKAADKVVSVRGMLHPGARKQKLLKKQLFLNMVNWAGIKKRCRFQASDGTEAGHIKKVFGNGVAVQLAGNFPKLLDVQEPVSKMAGKLKLVSVGVVSPMKNYLNILRAMKELQGEIEYNIYGPVKDVRYWEECLVVVGELPGTVKVIYNKELPPHMLAGKLAGNHVFILPSESENFGHAIIEALSTGLPVVTSYNTPWNHLKSYSAGLNIETTVSSISEALRFFMDMEGDVYQKYAAGAAAYARLGYDRNRVLSEYELLFANPAKAIYNAIPH